MKSLEVFVVPGIEMSEVPSKLRIQMLWHNRPDGGVFLSLWGFTRCFNGRQYAYEEAHFLKPGGLEDRIPHKCQQHLFRHRTLEAQEI